MASKKKKPETPTVPPKRTPGDQFLADARLRMEQALEGDQHNREAFVEAMKFLNLEQWPDTIKKKRRNLPCLVIDRINPAISQVLGDQRQNRPSIKMRPAGMGAKPELAELREGLTRNIWAVSQGDIALDTAGESQVQGGWGYVRVFTEYADDDVFEQNIKVAPVRNTLSVLFDPMAQAWDRMDGNYFFVFDKMSKEAYKDKYGEDEGIKDIDLGDSQLIMWRQQDAVIIAEYFWQETKEKKLYLIEQTVAKGKKNTLTVDEEKKNELMKDAAVYYVIRDEQGNELQVLEADKDELFAENPNLQVVDRFETVRVIKDRTVKSPCIYRCLIDGYRILEEKQEWPSKYWPVVPVDGKEIFVDGKIYRRGMTKNAMDAQRAYNYAISGQMTHIALSNKVPRMVTPEMIEGQEEQWARAHEEPYPYLLVNQEGIKAVQGWPQQQLPPQASNAYTQIAMQSAEDVRITTEVHQAALGMPSNETSGIAINARKLESDVGNYVFTDNLSRAVHRIGEIINDLIPVIYDTERVVTVMGADDTTKEVTVNKRVAVSPESGNINETLNDLTIGKYKVAVDVGPSYTTQRLEAAESMLKFVSAVPGIGDILADEIIRNMDFPGSQKIFKRIRAWMVQRGMKALLTDEELEELPRPPQQPGPPDPTILAQIQKDLAQAQKYLAEAKKIETETGIVHQESIEKALTALGGLSEALARQEAGQVMPMQPGAVEEQTQRNLQ